MTVRIGDRGKAATILRPGGFVTLDGVRHSARCSTGFVEAATEIVVTGGDNLGLIVRPIGSRAHDSSLPGHGDVVYSSFGAKTATTGLAREQRRIAAQRRAVRQSWICGGVFGLVCGAFAAFQLQPHWNRLSTDHSWMIPIALVAGGAAWGLVVGRGLYGSLEQIENHPNLRLTYTSIVVTLSVATAVLVYVTPSRGWWVGGGTALCATLLLSAAFPVFALVGEWLSGPDEGSAEAASDAHHESEG